MKNWILVVLTVLVTQAPLSNAAVEQLGLSYAYSVPMGNQYLSYKPAFSLFGQVIGERGFFDQNRLSLISQAGFQRYSLKNLPSLNYQVISAGAGLLFQDAALAKKNATNVIGLNLSMILGGAMEWLDIPAAGATFVGGFAGFAQLSPGVEWKITPSVSANFNTPVQFFIFKSSYFVWNSEFGFRFSL